MELVITNLLPLSSEEITYMSLEVYVTLALHITRTRISITSKLELHSFIKILYNAHLPVGQI
jgi:hypothetical protein